MKTIYKNKQHNVVIRGIHANDCIGSAGNKKYVFIEFGDSSVLFTQAELHLAIPTIRELVGWLEWSEYLLMRESIEVFLGCKI